MLTSPQPFPIEIESSMNGAGPWMVERPFRAGRVGASVNLGRWPRLSETAPLGLMGKPGQHRGSRLRCESLFMRVQWMRFRGPPVQNVSFPRVTRLVRAVGALCLVSGITFFYTHLVHVNS